MQVFIQVNQFKKAANSLQTMVADSLMDLDQSLHATLDQAKFRVFQNYDETLERYTGRCKLDRPTTNYDDDKMKMIYVGEYLQIIIFQVLNDFTDHYYGVPPPPSTDWNKIIDELPDFFKTKKLT